MKKKTREEENGMLEIGVRVLKKLMQQDARGLSFLLSGVEKGWGLIDTVL